MSGDQPSLAAKDASADAPLRPVEDEVGLALYRKAYTHGFVDAAYPEGYDEAEEAAAIKLVDSMTVNDGWDACRDRFLVTLRKTQGDQ